MSQQPPIRHKPMAPLPLQPKAKRHKPGLQQIGTPRDHLNPGDLSLGQPRHGSRRRDVGDRIVKNPGFQAAGGLLSAVYFVFLAAVILGVFGFMGFAVYSLLR